MITNSLNVAAAFAQNPDVEITDRRRHAPSARPGHRRRGGRALLLGISRRLWHLRRRWRRSRTARCWISTSMKFRPRQSIAANSRTAVLVADTTKFGRNATVRGGHLDDCHHLVHRRSAAASVCDHRREYSDRIRATNDARPDYVRSASAQPARPSRNSNGSRRTITVSDPSLLARLRKSRPNGRASRCGLRGLNRSRSDFG